MFSAFATAEDKVFLTSLDILLLENVKSFIAVSTFFPTIDFKIGLSFLIYNGKKFIPITVSEDMVGHKLGEFAPTRQFFGHTPADKKAKAEEGAKPEVKK